MKSFKQFMSEEVLDNYGGKKMYATNHFIDRKKERGANDAEVKHIFRSAVDHLNQNDYGDHENFLVYSKKHDRAIAFSHKQNPLSKDKRKHLIAKTIFPKGENYANQQTKLVNVETFSPEFVEYINSLVSEETRNAEPLSEVILEDIEFCFLHGELDNTPEVECITVE